MNDQTQDYTRDRSVSRGHLITRLDRLMRLWTTKWWIPLALGVIGSGAGYGLHKLDEPVFTSTSQMIVNVKLSLPEGSVYTEELSNFLGTQAALMQSGVVLDRAHARLAANRPDLKPQPVTVKA